MIDPSTLALIIVCALLVGLAAAVAAVWWETRHPPETWLDKEIRELLENRRRDEETE